MGELGLLGLTFSTEYGGSGMDSLAAVLLSEELARSGFGGVASSVTVQTDFSASHLVRVGSVRSAHAFCRTSSRISASARWASPSLVRVQI